MAFTTPPPAPQRGDRATFSSRTDVFLVWLVGLVGQLESFLASLTTMSVGGANTFSYTFDTSTADSDPGNGKLRLGSSPQNASVVMRLDDTAASGGSVAAFLTALAAVSSNTKASVRLQKVNDPSSWALFDVTAITAATGYRNLTVIPRGSSTASPFANGETLAVFFDRNGDKGDSGGTPTTQQIKDALGTLPVSSGGTGATTAAVARDNLGAKPSGVEPISTGGTGANNANQARINLGVVPASGGTMTGNLTFTNGFGLRSTDNVGAVRSLIGLDQNNNVFITNSGGRNIKFANSAGGEIANLTESGVFSAVNLIGTSDESLKEKWRSVEDDFLEKFAAIERAGLFSWKSDGREDGGIGAQSIQKIAPWCVFDVDGVLHVNYAALSVVVGHALTRRVLLNEKRT